MTDPVADLLTRIRNALKSKHGKVIAPSSKIKVAIVGILKDEGYIDDFQVIEDSKQDMIEIVLRYSSDGKPAISGIERVSRPGKRMYFRNDEIPMVLGGYGITIISTPKGLMTGRQSKSEGLGGEVICNVW